MLSPRRPGRTCPTSHAAEPDPRYLGAVAPSFWSYAALRSRAILRPRCKARPRKESGSRERNSTMTEHEASRTLVKSPPELWAECSDAESLARHLGEFGEIRITRLEPETAVAWEGEHASGTVRLEPSGWGTRVTLTATPIVTAVPEPAVEAEPEVVVIERPRSWRRPEQPQRCRRAGARSRASRSTIAGEPRRRRRRGCPRPPAALAGCSRVCGPVWVASRTRPWTNTTKMQGRARDLGSGRGGARAPRSSTRSRNRCWGRQTPEPEAVRRGAGPRPATRPPGAAGRGAREPRSGAPPPVLARLNGSGASGAATPEKPSP